MIRLKCSVPECQRDREGKKDHCLTHHRQIVTHRRITNKTIRSVDKSLPCKVDGCEEPYSCIGYCKRHYSQFRKHGKIISVERMQKKRTGEKMKSGYMYILKKGHPTADKRGYVKRSRLVWEENTGHIVMPPEIVHHKDEIKTNDDFGNLKLLPDKSAHIKEHGGRIGGVRIVTKEMVTEKMLEISAIIDGPLTVRVFSRLSGFSQGVLATKFGWNKLKEELCIL